MVYLGERVARGYAVVKIHVDGRNRARDPGGNVYRPERVHGAVRRYERDYVPPVGLCILENYPRISPAVEPRTVKSPRGRENAKNGDGCFIVQVTPSRRKRRIVGKREE